MAAPDNPSESPAISNKPESPKPEPPAFLPPTSKLSPTPMVPSLTGPTSVQPTTNPTPPTDTDRREPSLAMPASTRAAAPPPLAEPLPAPIKDAPRRAPRPTREPISAKQPPPNRESWNPRDPEGLPQLLWNAGRLLVEATLLIVLSLAVWHLWSFGSDATGLPLPQRNGELSWLDTVLENPKILAGFTPFIGGWLAYGLGGVIAYSILEGTLSVLKLMGSIMWPDPSAPLTRR